MIRDERDAIVRPFVAGRCDGDSLPIHRPVSRALQLGIRSRLVDPVVGCICGRVPFKGPFAIGHECVAEVVEVGAKVTSLRVGQAVIVPWAISCGECRSCRQGLTSKCDNRPTETIWAYGFGSAAGALGGMVSDQLRVPYADHMLVPVPDNVDPLRVAAASDNLADAWRAVAIPMKSRQDASVLVIGGGAKSIGLYAAGLAGALGAHSVSYVDSDTSRLEIADSFGASCLKSERNGEIPSSRSLGSFDVIVEASSRARGLRSGLRRLAPGGHCTAVGYYLGKGTRIPAMSMYATDGTLRIGVSHARAVMPEMLEFIATNDFAAESVTTTLADWDDAPSAFAEQSTKVVIQRDRMLAS